MMVRVVEARVAIPSCAYEFIRGVSCVVAVSARP